MKPLTSNMNWKVCAIFVCAVSSATAQTNSIVSHKKDVSPYIDLVFCPARNQPWSCAREQSARILDIWNEELDVQWQALKVEADSDLNSTIEKRGYSSSDVLTTEKPSSILKKIEIGTNFMKEYLAESMDGFLGREYEYDEISDNDDVEEGYNDADDDDRDDDSSTDEEEFIETDELERKKNQKKKKGQKGQKGQHGLGSPATVLLVQPAEHTGHTGGGIIGHGSSGFAGGMKQKKRRKKPMSSLDVEEDHSDNLGLGILDELADADELFTTNDGMRKRKHRRPTKYGRSLGVTRGKKKKKRKAIMKLVLLGTFLKAKIELLLKILGAHLQIKFFAIALIGLLINIARFWIDVKRGSAPQKVIYVEHAHHQHHYEDHGDDWGGDQGSYWKRSLQTDSSLDGSSEGGFTDGYAPRPVLYQQQDPHYLAYRSQVQ